jgi:hypothetical protein
VSYIAFQAKSFIKFEELEARYGFKANRATWREDLQHDKARCKQWQPNGGEILQNPPHRVFSKITAIVPSYDKYFIDRLKGDSTAFVPDPVYDNYRDIWGVIAESADGFSRSYTTSGLSDFNFRFYQGPITPPVNIVFSPLVNQIDETELQQLFEVVLHEAQKKSLTWPTSFEVAFMSKDAADKSSELVTFSVNPFGYFRTLIHPKDLIRLVNAQTEAAEAGEPQTDWIHAFPPPDKVKEADDKIMKKLPTPVRKQHTVTSIAFKKSSGGAQARFDSKDAGTIMGGLSANKVCSTSTLELSSDVSQWALDDLGWKLSQSNSNNTVAEVGIVQWAMA